MSLHGVRCWYYQNSPDGCTHENCVFVHDRKEPARPPLCAYWVAERRGGCRFGARCTFFHDDGTDRDVRGTWADIPRPFERKTWRKKETPVAAAVVKPPVAAVKKDENPFATLETEVEEDTLKNEEDE